MHPMQDAGEPRHPDPVARRPQGAAAIFRPAEFAIDLPCLRTITQSPNQALTELRFVRIIPHNLLSSSLDNVGPDRGPWTVTTIFVRECRVREKSVA